MSEPVPFSRQRELLLTFRQATAARAQAEADAEARRNTARPLPSSERFQPAHCRAERTRANGDGDANDRAPKRGRATPPDLTPRPPLRSGEGERLSLPRCGGGPGWGFIRFICHPQSHRH